MLLSNLICRYDSEHPHSDETVMLQYSTTNYPGWSFGTLKSKSELYHIYIPTSYFYESHHQPPLMVPHAVAQLQSFPMWVAWNGWKTCLA